jgi:flagellar basal body-associated protein FliL
MQGKIQKIILPILFIIGGIVFIILGVKSSAEIKNFPEVKATVTKIDTKVIEEQDSDGNFSTREEQTVYVKYTVDGKEYNEILQSAPNSKEGDTLTAHYNPKKPTYITGATKGSNTIFIIVGIVVSLIGLISGALFLIKGR